MTTTTESPHIAPPPGADPENSDYWDTSDAVTYRLIWSHPMPLPDELASEDVRVVAVQHLDGTIATDGDDQPLIYIGGSDYTVANARVLAQAIVQAADQADKWASSCTTCQHWDSCPRHPRAAVDRGPCPCGCRHANEVEAVTR